MKIIIQSKSGEGSMSIAKKISGINGLEIFDVHQEPQSEHYIKLIQLSRV